MKNNRNLFSELGLTETDDSNIAELNIDVDKVKRKTSENLKSDNWERVIIMKRKRIKAIAAAAAICAITVTTVFASETIRERIGNIISYFQNDNAAEISDIEKLAEFNTSIGKSVTKDGFTLTLDNAAADDNFVHVFYTLKSEDRPFYKNDDSGKEIWDITRDVSFDMLCVINGQRLREDGRTDNGYFADESTYKGVRKYNISSADISDKFKLEIFAYAADSSGADREPAAFEKIYGNKAETVTESEKSEIMYLFAELDKSAVHIDSVTKNIDIPLQNPHNVLERAVFSPFGNQLVIKSDCTGLDDGAADKVLSDIDNFALFDENGKCLDLLNKGMSWNASGISVNSFEFLKTDKNIKCLKVVPVKNIPNGGECGKIYKAAGEYPIEYKISDYGKIVITGVRIKDGEVDIDYYKDGFVMYDPEFLITDDNGEDIWQDNSNKWVNYVDVNYMQNSYTARYVYEEYDDNGHKCSGLPADVKAESISERVSRIGTFTYDDFTLDFDNAIIVDLK